MNKKDFYEENYYAPSVGYVLDGQRMTREGAIKVLCRSWYFSTREAISYLDRLVRAFNSRTATFKGGIA